MLLKDRVNQIPFHENEEKVWEACSLHKLQISCTITTATFRETSRKLKEEDPTKFSCKMNLS